MPKNNATVRAVAKLNAFKGETAIAGITDLPAGLRLVLAYPPAPHPCPARQDEAASRALHAGYWLQHSHRLISWPASIFAA